MILLSILIPSLPERAAKLAELMACLKPQDCEELEIIVLTDNRRSIVGAKRNALMALAHGMYMAHIDDDELLAPNYVERLLPELRHGADVVSYDASVIFNGGPEFRVTTGLDYPNEHPQPLGDNSYTDIRRKPWHWCCWRTDFARQFKFPEDKGWGEDAAWLEQCWPAIKTWRKIDEVLFFHRWSAAGTMFPTSDR